MFTSVDWDGAMDLEEKNKLHESVFQQLKQLSRRSAAYDHFTYNNH